MQVPSSVSAGGGVATGGVYRTQDDIGIPVAGTYGGGEYVHKMGYVAQLQEPVALQVSAGDTNLAEGSSAQLTEAVLLDDGTQFPLTNEEPQWGATSGPIQNVGNGLILAEVVYEDTPACAQAYWQGLGASLDLMVTDYNPDNFRSYAGDDLPDGWQVQYFGLDNPNAAPDADPFHCGQNNFFKYIAGLDPANSNSMFEFQIQQGEDGPHLIFNPRLEDRSYTVQCLTDLNSTIWLVLTNANVADDGLTRTLVDTNGLPVHFYRVQIVKP